MIRECSGFGDKLTLELRLCAHFCGCAVSENRHRIRACQRQGRHCDGTLEIVDSEGRLVTSASNTVTFKVISGPGRVLSTHSGEPATQVPAGSPSHPAYKGLVRAYVRSTQDSATSPQHRARLAEIDSETADVSVVAKSAPAATEIVVEASAEGLQPARVSIPVTDDLNLAAQERRRRVRSWTARVREYVTFLVA